MKIISLTQNKFALVDDEDYESLSKFKWCVEHADRLQPYAVTRHKNKIIRMHRMILKLKKKQIGDHINNNSLDNRKSNLRVVNFFQNAQNQSKQKRKCSSVYKGVTWSIDRKKWHSKVKHKGIYYNLGRFSSEKEAAIAYNNAAKKLFGSYAKINTI